MLDSQKVVGSRPVRWLRLNESLISLTETADSDMLTRSVLAIKNVLAYFISFIRNSWYAKKFALKTCTDSMSHRILCNKLY